MKGLFIFGMLVLAVLKVEAFPQDIGQQKEPNRQVDVNGQAVMGGGFGGNTGLGFGADADVGGGDGTKTNQFFTNKNRNGNLYRKDLTTNPPPLSTISSG